jgi:hypothetical protein
MADSQGWIDVPEAPAPASAPAAGGWVDVPEQAPEQSVGAAVKEFGHQMNPVSIAKGIWQTVSHPIDAAKAYLEAKQKIVTDAETALSKGDWTGFVRHMQTAALPIPGIDTAIEQASNKWDSGDKAGALGDAAALVAQAAIASQAPAIGRGLKATGAGIAAAAPDVAAGGAKVLAGEALAKVPGMEFPARIGLGYPGARQIGKGMGKFGEAFGKSLSPTPAKASAAAPAAAAPAVETLADGSTVQDIARGQGIKSWKNATADQKAGAQNIFDKLKAAEAAAPTPAAGAPPSSPTPSAPRAQPATAQAATPASAAPTVLQPNGGPLRPPLAPQPAAAAPSAVSATPAETPPAEPVPAAPSASEAPSVRNGAHQANIEAKAQRFVDATGQLFRDHPATANASMTPGTLRQALAAGGYIKNTEVFPDASWPLIQQGIADMKAARQTIRPSAGFSMGEMKNYRAQPASQAPSVQATPETADIDFQQRYGEQEQPEVAKFLGHDQPMTASIPARNLNEPPALARSVIDPLVRSGKLADEGARTMGIVIRRMLLSDSEAKMVLERAADPGQAGPISGSQIANALKSLAEESPEWGEKAFEFGTDRIARQTELFEQQVAAARAAKAKQKTGQGNAR